MEAECIFAPVVSPEEWKTVPKDIAKKIGDFTNEKFEEFIKCKALLETNRFNSEQDLSELRSQYEAVTTENGHVKVKLEVATNTIVELESQVKILTADVTRLQANFNKLETEAADFRHQRNLAVDERDEYLKMVQRRDNEIERMQADINLLTSQLEAAINAKCEALAQAEEVASMKLTIEYKEKRLDQERSLFTSQIESLTEDLNQRTEELLNMRRDNTLRCVQLENKLAEKTQELLVANELTKSIQELNNNLQQRNEELSQKLLSQRETEAKLDESYQYEIEMKTKMANAYKSLSEENDQHCKELKEALVEVQQLLKNVTDQYGELETKHKETVLAHEEILSKKNECIAMLKKELDTANELLELSKHDQIQRDIESLSPSAAAASKFMRSGMTMTEIYSQYVAVSEKLANKEEECARLNNYIQSVVNEIEEKGPSIKKMRADLFETINANEELRDANKQLMDELQELQEEMKKSKKLEGVTSRENVRLKKEVADLGRQVCHLLQELEHSRIGSSSNSTDMDLSDSVSSDIIITKKLVTFNDICELQNTNQKLLALVRELSEKQEEVEALDPAAIANMKRKLEELRESQNELLEERDRQNKMMITLSDQRDMFKTLYDQAMKGAGENISKQFERTLMSGEEEAQKSDDEKVKNLENQIANFKKQVQQLKEEADLYRKEKSDNEKILLEQLEELKAESKELTKLNYKLSSEAEVNVEKFKVLQNNMEIYKKQIAALEKQNKIFSEAIVKHEQASTYLKDQAMQAESKLSKAEVMLNNLQKENALLRDAEARLLRERESIKRESHQQNLMHTNIELIKATLERTDAEAKLRLEARLDEAHRECSALRRRLQEEQDRFRQLTEHLEKQTHNAQQRFEEEREVAAKLQKELAEVREELVTKASQVEELTKKIRINIMALPETSLEAKKIRELEQQVSDYQAEVQSLKAKLKTAKEASNQYCNVAEVAEKQMKDLLEKQNQHQQEIDQYKNTIKELKEKCAELESELSLHMDDQDMASANYKSKSHQLQEELSTKTMDLQTAREQLDLARSENKTLIEQLKAVENKYAREVTLHSVDLQALTSLKEELDKLQGEVGGLRSGKEQAETALEQNKQSWASQEALFYKEKKELEERFNDMEAQNSLLLDQLQALNTQLTILQTQASGDSFNQSTDTSFNRSMNEDEVKSSEQLLKIVKYLRQEKDIAVSKADIMEAEHLRLKSQFELVSKQYEEAKAAVEQERQKSEISVLSAAKHAEILRKMETLNAITDSNRSLRQERDELLQQVNELRTRCEKMEAEFAPLEEKNRDLTTKADQMQNENIALRTEATRWRQRANMLIEKTNRTSPEDWKKLQAERETLAKQLTIERSNNVSLNNDCNNLQKDKAKLEEQLKSLRGQNNSQSEELGKLREEVQSLQGQVTSLQNSFEQINEESKKVAEENKALTEDQANKEVMINELRNNLAQVRKIAKKYKIQYEDQAKDMESLKQQNEQKDTEQSSSAERQEQVLQEQRQEMEERIGQIESNHKEVVEQLSQQVSSSAEQLENFKKEVETLKQMSLEKEERFKNLFKNAKERIVSLTEQNTSLKEELHKCTAGISGESSGESSKNSELIEKIQTLQREKNDILEERQQDKEKHAAEIESLTQKINQLQRQLGLQQGSKPSTSSSTSEKSTSEPPTANIKPMAGHSTNTQTQSVPIQPWRSGGEPPLASIRPMSAQLRTVAVLPTSQSPSAAMVSPVQQQVHTTGSSTIDALSSSPTSSHTDYVPATSSASSAMLGPRQVAVPPTQSSQEEDDESMQAAPQQQAVALVLPRVEPPSSGPTQEQGTSSSSSNTVTTTQAGLKRQRDADTECQSEEQPNTQQSKRTRIQQAGTVSDSGLEVEYQVPTSSQRDHDDEHVIIVESDDEGGPDEGEGADDEQDDPDTEGYDMEGMEQDNYEEADCQDEEDEEEGGNEVEVIEDSSEVPNQSEGMQEVVEEENNEQAQSEAISSGTDGSTVNFSQASTSMSIMTPSHSRSRLVAPLSSRQSHLLIHGLEDAGDDGIVPSTPTLFVPMRSDGFGEAVSSPHVPSGRFTFSESAALNAPGSSEVVPEQTLEVSNVDDNSTGRSVPTTPLQVSPQEVGPGGGESSHQNIQGDAEIPSISVSDADDNVPTGEGSSGDMGPPSMSGTSEGNQQSENSEEMLEGDDGVSSEGEKPPATEEGGEEEGREAEASPSTNTRTRNVRGVGVATRRSLRQHIPRGNLQQRHGPTPIVWGEQRQMQQQRSPQQIVQQESQRGRQSTTPNYNRNVARRARGRMPRPYGRF